MTKVSPTQPMLTRRAAVLSAVLVLTLALAAGLALKRPQAKAATPASKAPSATLSVGTGAPEAPLALAGSFVLPFARAGIAVGSPGYSSLECAFQGTKATYVVDHPDSPPGARVRWYVDGKLSGTYHAPPGSLFFAPDGDGFFYIISKYAGPSETAVLVDASGHEKARYTIPRKLNAGGLRRVGDTLYALVWSGVADPKTAQVEGHDVLAPVAVGGKQLTDGDSEKADVDAWVLRADKQAWGYTLGGKNGALTAAIVHGQDRVVLPLGAVPLGVDASDRVWVAYPSSSLPARALAGWPARDDSTALLVAFDMKGRVLGTMAMPSQVGVAWPDIELARRLVFADSGLVIADRLSSGARLSNYGVTR